MRTLIILFSLVQLIPVAPPKTLPFKDRMMTLPYHRTPDMASSYRGFRFV